MIFSDNLENGEWRKLMDHELYRELKEAPIVKRLKINTIQGAGYTARIPEEIIMIEIIGK